MTAKYGLKTYPPTFVFVTPLRMYFVKSKEQIQNFLLTSDEKLNGTAEPSAYDHMM